jgi:hypothetical protein
MPENPYQSPLSPATAATLPPTAGKVWVVVDRKWVGRVRSPWMLGIAALTGVSVTFAPFCLLQLGAFANWTYVHWLAAGVCMVVIYLVPGFYMRLAGEVLRQLHDGSFVDGDAAR